MRTLSMLTLGMLAAIATAQPRPSWNGAFSAAQAGSGQQIYREECGRCHGQTLGGGESTPELAGAAFLGRWRGKSPADLLERTRKTMPTDNPGGLSGSKYEDVVAFIMSTNGYTPGARELGAASASTGAAGPKTVEWRYYGGDA